MSCILIRILQLRLSPQSSFAVSTMQVGGSNKSFNPYTSESGSRLVLSYKKNERGSQAGVVDAELYNSVALITIPIEVTS